MSTTTAAVPGPVPDAVPPLRRHGPFRWLMAGSAISLLGDQFTLVALPWAALQISGDPLLLGTVLALVGVPRAVLMLVGGAVTDRHSPHRVLMLSKHANALLLGTLATLVLTGRLSPPLLALLALAIGVASAFGLPSGSALLPQVVPRSQLVAANGLLMAQRQLSLFVGPLLAAGLIAWVGRGHTGQPGVGLGWAFALDALSFALSAWTLAQVPAAPRAPAAGMPPNVRVGVLAAVAEGLRAVWQDKPLRAALAYWALGSLLVVGPVQLALPLLASQRPGLGAAAFGQLLAVHGGGALLGMVLAIRRWRLGALGPTLLLADGLIGVLVMPLGQVQTLAQGALLMVPLGLLAGYLQVTVFTWLQQRVVPAMMGRTMALFMAIVMGLPPLAAAATGALLRWLPLPAVFTAAGAALLAVAVLAGLFTPMRRLVDAPAGGHGVARAAPVHPPAGTAPDAAGQLRHGG